MALIELDQFRESESILDTVPDENPFAYACKVWLYATANDLNKAKSVIETAKEMGGENSTYMAWMEIAVHDLESAFKWLDHSVEKRSEAYEFAHF